MRIMKQRHESGASITNLERIVLQRFIQCVVEVGLRDNSHSFVCKFALLTTGDALWNTLSAGILGFVCFTPKKKRILWNETNQQLLTGFVTNRACNQRLHCSCDVTVLVVLCIILTIYSELLTFNTCFLGLLSYTAFERIGSLNPTDMTMVKMHTSKYCVTTF